MTPQEYLSQYQQLNREIDRLLEEKERWTSLATRITPSQSDGGHRSGSYNGRVPPAVEKIFETENKIDADIDQLVDLRKEIEMKIKVLPDGKQKEVLHRRYILCQTLERIADQMNYSYMQICRIHERALQEFEKML